MPRHYHPGTQHTVFNCACPDCAVDATQSETVSTSADTKSDFETQLTVGVALSAFWAKVMERHPGIGPITGDTATRLEIAAYDAVEEWRAENPVEPIQVRTLPLRG